MAEPDSQSFRRAREDAVASGKEDPVRSYIQARQRLEISIVKVSEMVALITDGARMLRRWREVYVSDEGVPFPIDIMNSDDVIPGRSWPNAHEIAQTLSNYHLARTEAHSTWRFVPAEDRASLQPPHS